MRFILIIDRIPAMRHLLRTLSTPFLSVGLLLLLVFVMAGCAESSDEAGSSDTTTSTIATTTTTTVAPTTVAPDEGHDHEEEGHDHDDEGHDHDEAGHDDEDSGETVAEVVEVGEPRRLLVLASHDEPLLVLIDLADGSTESVEMEAMASQHGSSLGESGRFMLVGHSGEDGGVTVVDTGVWSEPHGNHFHHYTTAPAVVGHIDGPFPSHLVSHDGLNTFWFDGTGEFTVVTSESLEDGELTVMDTVSTGQPHHGFAVPLQDAFFVTVPTDDMEEMPNVVGISGLDGAVQTEATCPNTHGETILANGAGAACTDGIVLMTEEDGTWTSTRLPYPQVDEEDPWGYGPARPWSLFPNADSSLVAAPFGSTYVLIADPDEGTSQAVDLGEFVSSGQFVSPVSTQWVDAGHVTALTDDGSLHLIDAEAGSLVASLQIMEPFEEGPPDFRWREVAVTGDHVYVTDPVENQVIEIAVGDDLTVERIFDLGFTPGGFLEVANG